MTCAFSLARFVLCLGAILTFVGAANAAHPERNEPDLVAHWAVGSHPIENGEIEDLTHKFRAKVVGKPQIATLGPLEGVVLDGLRDYLIIADDISTIRASLPTRQITLAAWVLISNTAADGGIVSAMVDNGSLEKGWVLGYNEQNFSFAISTKGPDDGDGKLTYLRGKTPIVSGRWFHVAGTYDGVEMRLYVNGQLDASSNEQSGDIVYPDKTPVAIGCYVDTNERNPLDGAIYEVKIFNSAHTGEKINAVAQKGSLAMAWEPPQSKELDFLVTPYLQFATKTSIVIMCETTRPSTMKVEFGLTSQLDQSASSTTPALISETLLSGLTPQTHYLYRVICTDESGNKAVSKLLSFQTAVNDDTPYAFTVIGDTQRNPTVTEKINTMAYALRPNFQLHCGDVVDDGHSKSQWLKDLLGPSSVLMSHVPMYPVIGNHEEDSHWYYDYFSLPKPEYYYTFKFGNAQFFMIDSNKDLSPGSEQYIWLERELGASTATWKFTCHHHPCFSSDSDDYGDTMKGPSKWGDSNAQKLISLYERHGVDIAFNGHIHVYERTWPIYQLKVDPIKGVRYITSGGAGGGLERAAPQRTWFSLHFNPAHHFCYVTIHGKTIQFKAYDLEGRLFDVFEMTKP